MAKVRTSSITSDTNAFRRDFGQFVAAWTVLVLVASVLVPGNARSESSQDRFGDDRDGWEFGFGGEFGFYRRTAEANASGTPLGAPRASNVNTFGNIDGPDVVIEPIQGAADIWSLVPGVAFSVMTPVLIDMPTQPRLFFDGSVNFAMSLESPIAREGDPGRFELPEASFEVTIVGEPLVLGTGSEIRSQEQDYQLHAGMGVAFTVDVSESRFRIKPSLQYERSIRCPPWRIARFEPETSIRRPPRCPASRACDCGRSRTVTGSSPSPETRKRSITRSVPASSSST